MQTARIASVLFLLAMVIILVDFGYHMQEKLTDKMVASEAEREASGGSSRCTSCCAGPWGWLYLLLSAVFVIGSLAGIIVLYKFTANVPVAGACGNNLGFLSITLISGVVFMIVSPLECLGGRGLLTPAFIFAYCTWLCWQAIYANPDPMCSPVAGASSNTGATIVGMIIAALSLCYTAFSASNSLPHMFDTKAKAGAAASSTDSDSEHEREPLALAPHTTGSAKLSAAEAGVPASYAATSTALEDEDESPAAARRRARKATRLATAVAHEKAEPYSATHAAVTLVILLLAAMYMSPVLTNWVTDPSDVAASRNSFATMWVNIATQWATIILYTWTLIAPKLCTNRDFS
ncbi:hypothetical protein EON66_05970 [archaeon]|nr:MAG: hypothetical protein EON66_05970 [archaeon]